MKCKYTFKIEGKIKPSHDLIIPLDGWEYSFNLKEGCIESISIIVPNFPLACTPKVTLHKNNKVKASIQIPEDPFIRDVMNEMRSLESLLSLY